MLQSRLVLPALLLAATASYASAAGDVLLELDGDSGKDTLDLDGRVRFRGQEKSPEKYSVKLYSFERRR